jgi:hypothetical protein
LKLAARVDPMTMAGIGSGLADFNPAGTDPAGQRLRPLGMLPDAIGNCQEN